MQKTLLVAGAGFGQVPAIKKAREMGIHVVTVDKNPDAMGMKLADTSYEIDVLDKEAILSVARKHHIDGIMTLQSDFGVPAVGYVNDHAHLKGISYETALSCSDKMKCRSKLADKGCNQPKFIFVKDVEKAYQAAEQFDYPLMIKASDSSGSRGITKVKKPDDIEKGFKEALKYSKHNTVIVEEFVDGLEFGAQTFSMDGKCELVLLHNDSLSEPPKMIPIGHSFPFKYHDKKFTEQSISAIKQAVEAMGIVSGPANVDLILDNKSQEINIIEIAPRIGATCLPELVEYHTGIDWITESIKNTVGIEPDLTLNKKSPVAALIVESPVDGTFLGYSLDCDPQDYNVTEYEVTANKGDRVFKLRNGTDRIGKVIAYGMDSNEAESNAKRFLEHITINVE